MPASLSQLGEMEMLDLSSNQLSGKSLEQFNVFESRVSIRTPQIM